MKEQIVTYKTIGDVELKLQVLGIDLKIRKPAIIFFFGGGWVGGDRGHFLKQSTYLASRGLVTICADYRTESKHQTSPKECLLDAKAAMRYVRAHAENFNIDPNKIIAAGGSAGGHLAAATALTSGFTEGDFLNVSCVPNALVLFNPVIDNGPNGFGFERVKEYWEAFSPMANIKTGAPPTTIMLGDQDKLIPVETAEKFKQKMEAVGSRCDIHLYEGEEHGFFNESKYKETLLVVDQFLTSLGYLSGSSTL